MMKIKLIVSAMLLIFSVSTISAQRGFDIDAQMKTLKEKLHLNEEQVISIKAIFIESRKEFESIRDNFNGDRMSMVEEFHKIKEKTDEKIIEQLNDKQKIEYEKLNKEIVKQRKQKYQRGM